MKFIQGIFAFALISTSLSAQSPDEVAIRTIFNEALQRGKSYDMLRELSTNVGARLSGSPGAAKGVVWSEQTMKTFGFDSVWKQPVMVPQWVRGQKEVGKIISNKKEQAVNICALGGSVGTGTSGITAQVIEVKNFDELKALGTKNVQGKIVFFNRPMDASLVDTFEAYGGAVNQRALGPSEAAKYGAVAAVVRSMGAEIEDYPHTGGLRYAADVKQIPAVAISTLHAEVLSKLLKEDKTLQFHFESHSTTLQEVESFNVIGEIKGSEYPDEIIVVGGHLDSWDLAQGAHDDGAGCVQSIEVLRIMKAIGYKPKHTIRAVMFMNEENGLRGGTKYAELAKQNKENHVAAIESDRGGFVPRGFTITAAEPVKAKIKSWKKLFEPYGLTDFEHEGGGADIGPLNQQFGVPVLEFLPDSQRYFKYHHTKEDTFDKVNQRELELGAASITSLVYLMDQYGLK